MQRAPYAPYWGKAQSDSNGKGPATHPVWAHSLDVAVVATVLLRNQPLLLQRVATACGLANVDAQRLVVWLASIHDIGKFSLAFQSLAPRAWPVHLGDLPNIVSRKRHTDLGRKMWEGKLNEVAERVWSCPKPFFDKLAFAAFGHHGEPVNSSANDISMKKQVGSECLAAAKAYVDAVTDLLLGEPITAKPPKSKVAGQFIIAGLVNLADWIGSNQEWFPYCNNNDGDLKRYYDERLAYAERAVKKAGICTQPRPKQLDFRSLTGITGAPSPMQKWALDVELPDGPMFVCLEDLTGGGKTEAAHILSARRIAQGQASGVYWAMPTMATANAMWSRQKNLLSGLFGEDASPSVVLAHGKADLAQDFLNTVGRQEAGYSDDEDTASMHCAAWIADDRRRAFLADVGAGTIDQALLSILPTRFFVLRLLGLSQKVLVIDEAHSYDSYVATEMQRLTQFQLGLGGDVVILSATMAACLRTKLVCQAEDMFAPSREESPWVKKPQRFTAASNAPYPLATLVSSCGIKEERICASERVARRVEIRQVASVDEALDVLETSARQGAACCYVRNAVDDAREAWDKLSKRGLNPILFHARFAQGDRQQIEEEVVKVFGKDAKAEARHGRVLVATQTVEQSLDLDFDVLVSDLAPIDALIQRMGRFRRHPERDASRTPDVPTQVLLVSPPPAADASKEWLHSISARIGAVYRDQRILWLTAKVLFAVGAVDTRSSAQEQEQVRNLMAAVYDNDSTVPKDIETISLSAEAKDKASGSIAQNNILEYYQGYDGERFCMIGDYAVPTRLDEPTTVVRLARAEKDEKLLPWIEDQGSEGRAWSLSEVRLATRRVPRGAEPSPETKWGLAVEKLRKKWPRHERDIVVAVLNPCEVPEQWQGELHQNGKVVKLQYSKKSGACVVG